MAQVKVLAHRVMVIAALAGAGVVTMTAAAAAADGCYYVGSFMVRR